MFVPARGLATDAGSTWPSMVVPWSTVCVYHFGSPEKLNPLKYKHLKHKYMKSGSLWITFPDFYVIDLDHRQKLNSRG